MFSLCLLSVCVHVFVYWSLSSKESLAAVLVVTLSTQPTPALDAQQPEGSGHSVVVFCPVAKRALIFSESPSIFSPSQFNESADGEMFSN